MEIPLGPILCAEDLDEKSRCIIGDLGDDPVPILGSMGSLPDQLTDTTGPASRRVEAPSAARKVRAAEESTDR
jgi:hypothetical protein